ncbi:VPA1262 family N-terminal domain-containing protein [Komagataeibacter rhaeticus]|uniref:Uncharacterized protein n=1 Tax=Komagataeibacter rhaeticus TaxID=215221 RepID=A0A181C5W1_9PROT|nr:VPA1262 family N-terminal domain-containing protein [Komagataeibacter rhaeticus]QIP36770.1 hypothetical protein GWK63_16270 [Komagataeibacter rhaeticus]QOC46549.1 hypothetical protein ICJ78_16330 [Komagataeibacter rhaeticus]WPP21128.1 VPA1262 family N-terminal domain-containing protein [Komagataeibacter rhaeticus]SAY46914.1 hypothetical protein KRIGEM_03537 [Komagataeibacter rhaeticus]
MEVIGTPKNSKTLNIISIAVLKENIATEDTVGKQNFLTKRFKIEGFKDWTFGVVRTILPLSALDNALKNLAEKKLWSPSGKVLETGALSLEPSMFVRSDGSVPVALNKILQNNFWAGSHVFRLIDHTKGKLFPFFSDRRRLQTLSDVVSGVVPIEISSLSDFLGDILIQIPVSVVVLSIKAPRNAGYSEVTVTWRPGSAPRPLVIAARTQWDHILTNVTVGEKFQETVRLSVNNHYRPLETEILDEETGIIMSATALTPFPSRANIRMYIQEPEPRLFTIPRSKVETTPERIKIRRVNISSFGGPNQNDANYWLNRRQDLDEKKRLSDTRDFVQYRPLLNSSTERNRALEDIRFLLDKHGDTGVDLWDPYLTGHDLLETLFWCDYGGVPLRALTDGKEPIKETATDTPKKGVSFSDEQKNVLDRCGGNRQGLCLEYRTRRGPKGWSFHDRFLIFPNAESGPLAWSLGTSVNSLGLAHHILQRVSNPAMVAGAFEDLWNELDEPQHLIWRSK